MKVDPKALTLDQLRRRFLQDDQPVSPQLMRKLQRDPRVGVRRLSAQLKARQEKVRQEKLRLDAMLNFERVLWQSGLERIAGVDEAGVGPLAGPVVAAAVVFPPHTHIAGIDDSKRLDAESRCRLSEEIRRRASGIGIGLASVGDIDRLNIYHASLLAMRRAVEALPIRPQHVLVDAREIPEIDAPQNKFFKGDGLNFSIAAASIMAKTHRDSLMEELDAQLPGYGFAHHKGYSTPEHQQAIRRHGPSPVHRRSFLFIKELCGNYSAFFYDLRNRFEQVKTAGELKAFETELEEYREGLAAPEYRKLTILISRRWKTV